MLATPETPKTQRSNLLATDKTLVPKHLQGEGFSLAQPVDWELAAVDPDKQQPPGSDAVFSRNYNDGVTYPQTPFYLLRPLL